MIIANQSVLRRLPIMKERERVLELVQKGILTTEEALVLLENMAKEKDEKIVDKEAQNVKSMDIKKETPSMQDFDDSLPDIEDLDDTEEKIKEQAEKDRRRLEQILDELATAANNTSVELDEVNEQLKEAKADLKAKEELLMVFDTKEELSEIEENKEERVTLAAEVDEVAKKIAELESQKTQLEDKLKNIRKEEQEEKKSTSRFDIPDDWKETATETLSQVGEKVGEAGSQLGRFLKKTITTVVDSVNDNVDWKEVNFKVPGIASTKFDHTFNYPNTQATLIDVKVANGEVIFKTWDREDIKIDASIKLYGKMNAATPLEAFLERSEIEVDDEKISFQVPNKRIKADLTFYLPARMYDHVAIKMLNGDISIENLQIGDFYGKSTNGDLQFNQVQATMLEIEGVNGDVEVNDSKVLDFLADTVNGDFILKAAIENIHVTSVNGDVKITSKNDTVHRIDTKLVNGTIKVAVPKTVGIEGTAKTNIGSIKNRLENYEVIREKKDKGNQFVELYRANEEDRKVTLKLATTTGSIYLKDAE